MALVTVEDEDYLVGFNYYIEVGEKIAGFFTECSGVGSENEVIEAKQTTKKGQQVVRKVPGRLKWTDITLKRGVTSDFDFWTWSNDIANGKVDAQRYNGSLVLLDQESTEVARWNFERAWLKDITGPTFKSDGSDIAMEEIVLAHEYIVRVK